MTTLYRSTCCLFIVFSLLLSGCTTSPKVKQEQSTQVQPQSAADWLRLADTAAEPEQSRYRLNAALLLYQQGDGAAADRTLQQVSPQHLQGAAIGDYIALQAQVINLKSGPQAAEEWLNQPQQRQALQSQTTAVQAKVYGVLADLQNAGGNHIQAVNTRIGINASFGNEGARLENQDKIWLYLMNLTPAQLQDQLHQGSSAELQGWLELALVAVDNRGDIEQQRTRLSRWQRHWPDHPANQHPPGDMELLQYLSEHQASEIAVLLPLQGRLQGAGKAIRDGILAAYFDTVARNGSSSQISFYDTEQSQDIRTLYQRAVNDGAELIIGPLTKQRVQALGKLDKLPVPVLALNYAGDSIPTNDNFFQFGLSGDDDAREAANRAWKQHYRRAFIVQAHSGSSRRTAEAFQQAWQELEGETAAVVKFDAEIDASSDIRKSLQIQRSEDRAQRIAGITGEKLEFSPRRRQDVDFVYMPVSALQARSLKPLLAFHFAQDLPVFASSQVYTGSPDSSTDSDLNGIYFTDTPWALGASPYQSERIERYVEQGATPSKNLYALGIDAFLLAPRMSLMRYTSTARFDGLTGSLMVTKQGLIMRQPSWAVFKNGLAKPLQK